MNIKNLEVKALVSKLQALEDEVEMIDAINENFMEEFFKQVDDIAKNFNKKRKDELDHQPDVVEDNNDKSELNNLITDDVKKLYRQIVTLTHPDKLKTEDLTQIEESTELFNKATTAYNDGDLIELLKIANILKINDFEINESHLDLLKNRLKKLQTYVDSQKNSPIYAWYTGDDQAKNFILKNFMQNRYN